MTESKARAGAPPPMAFDSRRRPRRKTLIGGLVVSRDGMRTLPCTIRELSDEGARVKIINHSAIPEHVIPMRAFLIVAGRDRAHEIAVIWVKRDEYGVKIVASHSLARPQPEFEFLRRLNQERLPRSSVA